MKLQLDTTRFDAVVFDMDGVITNTATVHAQAWKRTFDEFLRERAVGSDGGFAPFSDDDYRSYVDGKQRQDGVASFLEARGVHLPFGEPDDPPDRDTVWGLANRKDQDFQRTIAEQGVEVFPSSVALVAALQRHGLATAIVSASRNAQRVLEAAGIGNLFAVRVDGIDAARLGLPGKPSPALFVEAAHRLGVIRARAVVLEDALAGVEAGRRGGFGLVVGIDRAARAAALQAAGADVVVSDLAQLDVAGAEPAAAECPALAAPPDVPRGWALTVDRSYPELERVRSALMTLADGRIGIRAPAWSGDGPALWAAMLGVYDGTGAETHLLPAPTVVLLPFVPGDANQLRRVLDLRAGVLHETIDTVHGPVSVVGFASLAHPGTVVVRAAGAPPSESGTLLVPNGGTVLDRGTPDGVSWMRVGGSDGGIVAAAIEAVDSADGTDSVLERICVYDGDPVRVPTPDAAVRAVRARARDGFDALVTAQRRAWAARWDDADVTIEGDDELQAATRLGLFHLMASVPDRGEAAVGARGLSGPGYRGHVFWDADTFVLPFLAATHPAAARAMLEYRVRRLPAAVEAARHAGLDGARFPWESASSGQDVTPLSARTRAGQTVAIRTGQLEEHIVAQIAWAACCYVDWTGDEEFARGDGLRLLTETARYWASRIRVQRDGTAHIYGVIGPDEYHEPVDDNAFTNVMARWNLRRAADALELAHPDAGKEDAARWRALADRLVDGYDARTGLYEQFAGFYRLEPLIIEEVAPRRPVVADLLLGADRVHRAQVVKQADVLMLHHLVPGEVQPGSLEPNLHYYEPRTAHGSSLSPAIHAALFARVGDFAHALEALHATSRIDLDDLTATTADGLHLGAMGGLWQVFAYGFFGLRPHGNQLAIDPQLPPSWHALEITVRFRASRVQVRLEAQRVVVRADPPIDVVVGSVPFTAPPTGLELERDGGRWRTPR